MKKSYLILAAVAGLFASCSQEVLVDETPQVVTESVIGFSTFAESQTRPADNNSSADTKYDLENYFDTPTFNVWAQKYYESAWESVYAKGTVSHASGAWTANPLKFWDKSAEKYLFYAAAPANDDWVLNNNGTATDFSDDYLTRDDFTLTGDATDNMSEANTTTDFQEYFKEATNDVDLLIAENNEVLRSAYNKADPEVVNEIFDHILSRLNVTVKRGTTLKNASAVVKLTSFAITGVNLKNKGSFDESKVSGSTLSAGTIGRWYNLSVDGTYNLAGYDISTTALADDALYIAQYLIIPQAITSEVLDRANGKVGGTTAAAHPYFRIAYTINDEPYVAYYNLANAFGVAGGSTLNFCEGWMNTLNITLDADVITFDAEVWNWKDKVSHSIIIED